MASDRSFSKRAARFPSSSASLPMPAIRGREPQRPPQFAVAPRRREGPRRHCDPGAEVVAFFWSAALREGIGCEAAGSAAAQGAFRGGWDASVQTTAATRSSVCGGDPTASRLFDAWSENPDCVVVQHPEVHSARTSIP